MQRYRLHVASAALLAVVLVIAAGCGSAEEQTGGTAGSVVSTQSTGVGLTSTTVGPAAVAGLAPIELTGPPETGAGEVPVFEWQSVPGAARYRLVVLDSTGGLLWAWNGAETKVRLGGLPNEYPEGTPSPVVTAGCSWSVAAFDIDGAPLAVSAVRSVAP